MVGILLGEKEIIPRSFPGMPARIRVKPNDEVLNLFHGIKPEAPPSNILSKSENATVQNMFSCVLGQTKTIKGVWIVFPKHLANDRFKVRQFVFLLTSELCILMRFKLY